MPRRAGRRAKQKGLTRAAKDALAIIAEREKSFAPLVNGTSTYTLRLAPLPPVAAFWSLTMYDAKTKLFVDNISNRYPIGDRTAGIKTEKNGSLTITMSYAEPSGADANQVSQTLQVESMPSASIG